MEQDWLDDRFCSRYFAFLNASIRHYCLVGCLQTLFLLFVYGKCSCKHVKLFVKVVEKEKFDAAQFSPFWNEIIGNLREEDYITNLWVYCLEAVAVVWLLCPHIWCCLIFLDCFYCHSFIFFSDSSGLIGKWSCFKCLKTRVVFPWFSGPFFF